MWGLELVLYFFIFLMAILALMARDLLVAVMLLTVFSFAMALLFTTMGAIDVAFTEAVVGAGVTGIVFLVALFQTKQETND
ncbi:MAG TPA: DUF4040 domain-containing protein [Planctomycetota bacterium]|jgi:uncharacterized MnhB-related membrane protein|nr:DUF4040 domain-containing protein [Planctomycetota bacterium]